MSTVCKPLICSLQSIACIRYLTWLLRSTCLKKLLNSQRSLHSLYNLCIIRWSCVLHYCLLLGEIHWAFIWSFDQKLEKPNLELAHLYEVPCVKFVNSSMIMLFELFEATILCRSPCSCDDSQMTFLTKRSREKFSAMISFKWFHSLWLKKY